MKKFKVEVEVLLSEAAWDSVKAQKVGEIKDENITDLELAEVISVELFDKIEDDPKMYGRTDAILESIEFV